MTDVRGQRITVAHALIAAAGLLALAGCDARSSGPSTRPAPSGKPPTAPATEPATAGPAPRIEAAEPIFDLGKRWSTEPTVKHDFVIRNTGQAPLHIQGVMSSCGCTHVGRKNVTIEPGKTWNLSVELDLRRQQPLVLHKITVLSDDPRRPKLELKIRGMVRQPISITPHNGMFFGRIASDERRQRVVTIKNNTDESMDPRIARCQGSTFTAKLDSVTLGKEYKLTMTARPPYKPGVNTGHIELTTGITLQPTLTIRPQAFLPPRILVAPATLMLPKSLPDGAKETISVRNNGPKDVKILRATCPLAGVTVEISQLPNQKVHNLTVRFPNGFVLPAEGSQLVIHTDDDEFKEIKVPIFQQGPAPPAGMVK